MSLNDSLSGAGEVVRDNGFRVERKAERAMGIRHLSPWMIMSVILNLAVAFHIRGPLDRSGQGVRSDLRLHILEPVATQSLTTEKHIQPARKLNKTASLKPLPEPEPLITETNFIEVKEAESSRLQPEPETASIMTGLNPVFSRSSMNYPRMLHSRIDRAKRYPEPARRRGQEGLVKVRFSVLRDGRVESIELSQSSSHPFLDQAALAAVRDAAPFPPLPRKMRADIKTFVIPIRFYLD